MIFAALGAALLYAIPVLLAARGVGRGRALAAGLVVAVTMAALPPLAAAEAGRPALVQAAVSNVQQRLQPALAALPVPASATAGPVAGPPPPPPKLPRLRIPSLKVDAWLGQVGLDTGGNIEAPKSGIDVGWYRFSVAPGAAGNAIVDGHVDWYDNAQGVFWNLDRVRVGEAINLAREDGSTLAFAVDSVTTVDQAAHPAGLYSREGAPTLTLITCGGRWDPERRVYLSRVLVRAHLLPPGTGT